MDLMEISYLGLGVSRSITLCIMSFSGALYFFLFSVEGIVSDDSLARHLYMIIADYHLKSFYLFILTVFFILTNRFTIFTQIPGLTC